MGSIADRVVAQKLVVADQVTLVWLSIMIFILVCDPRGQGHWMWNQTLVLMLTDSIRCERAFSEDMSRMSVRSNFSMATSVGCFPIFASPQFTSIALYPDSCNVASILSSPSFLYPGLNSLVCWKRALQPGVSALRA